MYTHDKEGVIGTSLRSAIQSTGIQGTFDDNIFATLIVTGFMQLAGILMLPEFYGPSYNLFLLPKRIVTNLTSTNSVDKSITAKSPLVADKEHEENTSASGRKRKKKKNKKKKA